MINPPSGPVQIPDSPTAAIGYLNELVAQVYAVVDELYRSFFTATYAVPAKPRDFMIRFADGTSWNPGYGAGLYQYYSGVWHPMWRA